MRKTLIALLIVIVTMSILWIFTGRQISSFVDEFKMAELNSLPIHSISYNGTEDGGTLLIDDHQLTPDLSPLNPHIGSSKDNELALAYGGKVFAFGPLHSSDALAADVAKGDNASFVTHCSYLYWLSLGRHMTPHLQQNGYCELLWNKPNGARLKMLWSVDPDNAATSLIRIDISNAGR
jgi:hypothetical protein